MKFCISITGRFAIVQDKIEKMLIESGYRLVDFSPGRTDILVVGVKTASSGKIKKAEEAGIRIIRETEPAEIIKAIDSGYRDHYSRVSGEIASVGIKQLVGVLNNFFVLNTDEGEWEPEDVARYLEDMEETKKYLLDGLRVRIIPEEEKDFWKYFKRWLILEYINLEHCDGVGLKISYRQLVRLTDEEFWKKTLSLEFIDCSAEEKDEYRLDRDKKKVIRDLFNH